jgi:hypothetical protein
MSQENFDDLLRQSFDKERDIPFDESAWQALSDQLPVKNKKYALPLWALLLLGSGWLIATFAFIRSANTEQAALHEIEDVTKQVLADNPSSLTDTVYLEQVIVLRDTVIQYRYLHHHTQHSKQPISVPAAISTRELQETKPLVPEKKPNYTSTYVSMPRLIDQLETLPTPPRMEYIITSLPNIQKAKRRRWEIGVDMGTHLGDLSRSQDGLLNGLANRTSQDESSFPNGSGFLDNSLASAANSDNTFTPVSLYQYGIKANYEILNNLYVQAGVGQENISYENYDSTPFDRSGALNALRSYAGTDQLLTQKSIYYELGLQKRFGNKRIQPIAHMGLRMRSNLNRVVQANTFSDQPAYLYNLSYSSTRLKESNTLRMEQIRMGLGINLQFAKQWSMQTSVDSYSSLRSDSWIRANWGVNMSLVYKL